MNTLNKLFIFCMISTAVHLEDVNNSQYPFKYPSSKIWYKKYGWDSNYDRVNQRLEPLLVISQSKSAAFGQQTNPSQIQPMNQRRLPFVPMYHQQQHWRPLIGQTQLQIQKPGPQLHYDDKRHLLQNPQFTSVFTQSQGQPFNPRSQHLIIQRPQSQLYNQVQFQQPEAPSVEQQPYFLRQRQNSVPRHQIKMSRIHLNNQQSLEQLYWKLFSPERQGFTPVVNTSFIPKNISEACPQRAFFYSLNPFHRQAIEDIQAIIMSHDSIFEKLHTANTLRNDPNMNPKVWYYALSECSARDPGLQTLRKPPPVMVMPDVFLNIETFQKAKNLEMHRSIQMFPHQRNSECIVLDGSFGIDNGVESPLWYFREDIQLNSHHWYWHLSYPRNSKIREDRRGELFYYFHQSILARYDSERLSHNLSRITSVPMTKRGDKLDEGYFSHLADSNSGYRWTDRQMETIIADLIHENNPELRQHIEILRNVLTDRRTLIKAINQGYVWNDDLDKISLRTTKGTEVLADILEANIFNPYSGWYSEDSLGIHNNGQLILAYMDSPNYTKPVLPGPMGDIATEMRDPVFYRWITFLNDIFDIHKSTLPPYEAIGGDLQLLWPGVHVVSANLLPWNGYPNQLHTFWNQKRFAFNRGLNFNRPANSEPVNICTKHMDHGGFLYKIVIDKHPMVLTSRATVRIFLAPRYDEVGYRLCMSAQRYTFFALDIFKVNLRSGLNVITRNSTQSSLTIPWQQTSFSDGWKQNHQKPYCGCGWPHHLLLPRGTLKGMVFDLFVILTNGDEDEVPGQLESPPNATCYAPYLQCGILNGKYPDARPMGYPFDRKPFQQPNGAGMVKNLDDYVKGVTNIGINQVIITHYPN